MRSMNLLLLGSMLAGCFVGDEEGDWASRSQIIEAAKRCGVGNFEPTEAGGGWAAYVSGEDKDRGQKTNCIYDDLAAQGLRATR